MTAGRARTVSDSIDLEHLIRSFYGRWIVRPILVAVAAIVGTGLVLQLSGLGESAPTWVHGTIGAIGVTAYYAFQIRIVIMMRGRRGGIHADDGIAIGSQRNEPGAVAPTIHGSAVFNFGATPSEISAKRAAAEGATGVATARRPPAAARQRQPKALDESQRQTERIGRTLEVPPADHEEIEFFMEKGDTVEGTFRSDASLNVYVMTENQYLSYWESREPGTARVLVEDESSGRVRWKAPRSGTYHLVFDTYGKQVSRTVRVSLIHRPPVA